jgi:hypothetical protein
MADDIIQTRNAFYRRADRPKQFALFAVIPFWVGILTILAFDNSLQTSNKVLLALAMLFLTGIGYLFVYGLIYFTEPMRAFCPHCEGFVPSNTDWQCNRHCRGSTQHKSPKRFSLFYKCSKCKESAKAYVCHHEGCGKTIFLTEDKDSIRPATAIGKVSETLRKDPFVELAVKKKELEQRIALKQEEIDLKQREVALKSLENHVALNPATAWERDLEEAANNEMGLADAVMKKRIQWQKDFADNPQELQKRLDWLDDYYVKHIDESPRLSRGL